MKENLHRFSFASATSREARAVLEAVVPSLNVEIAAQAEGAMEIDISTRLLDDGIVSRGRLGNILLARTPAHIARDGNDDLCLSIGLFGKPATIAIARRRNGRQEQVVAPGGAAVLYSNADPWILRTDASVGLAMTMPRARLAPFIADLDAALHEGIVAPSPALTLLTGHVNMLTADIGPLDAGCALQAADILRDLLILALGPTRDGAQAAKANARAALFAKMTAEIDAHLATPELSLDWLSRRFRISERVIRDLFYAHDPWRNNALGTGIVGKDGGGGNNGGGGQNSIRNLAKPKPRGTNALVGEDGTVAPSVAPRGVVAPIHRGARVTPPTNVKR